MFSVNAEWKSKVPAPIFDERPEYNELYWKAWELAHDHMLDVPGMPQTPYMDEAFCDTEIWIWDTCFMSLFCKYAQSAFPGVESLRNFYEVLYGDKKLPTIITRNAPAWTGETMGQPAQVKIHIFDNPPLFAWAELNNALLHGNKDQIRQLLIEKQYLQRHFERLESLQAPAMFLLVRNETCLRKHPRGYFWEGGRSGMDNTPRGRPGAKSTQDRPSIPQMLWVDALAQQGLTAYCIVRLAEIIDERALAAEWLGKYQQIKQLVNEFYWDEEDGFYYDIHADTAEHLKVMTPASFWPLVSFMPDAGRVERMVRYLTDPQKLGGCVPWVTLARDDADFNGETGEYWRGSVWAPTAYMGIKGLENYDKFDLARDTARQVVEHFYLTYSTYQPHTIWEAYNPSRPIPACGCGDDARTVRKDFCGWSALVPICLYLENIIGLYSADAFANVVKWRLPAQVKGKIGARNFRFGAIVTDIIYEDGRCSITSNLPYEMVINGTPFFINPGSNSFAIALG